jgi:hypothetical protein
LRLGRRDDEGLTESHRFRRTQRLRRKRRLPAKVRASGAIDFGRLRQGGLAAGQGGDDR